MNGERSSGSIPDVPSAQVPDVVGLDAVDACTLVRQAGLVPADSE